MTFTNAVAILPVVDISEAVAHYRQLGFTTRVYDGVGRDDRPIYAYLKRDGIELHLTRAANLNPRTNTSAVYLYVDDPDALHGEWCRIVPPDQLQQPQNCEWGMREMSYIDPNGNLLRIGRVLG